MNKYQAQIRHKNGDIITTITDNNKKRFQKELEKANADISGYIGECNEVYSNDDLFIEEV